MNLALNKIQDVQELLEGLINADTQLASWFAKKGFSADQRMRFYDKLSRLEANGVGLQDAIVDLKARAEKRGKTGALSIILHHVQRDLSEGISFAQSLSRFVPINEAMVIRAGEDSGSLNKALLICVDIIKANQEMKRTVLTAVAYPALLTPVFCVALYVIGRYAMPNILLKVDPYTLHGPSKWLYEMSLFMQTDWIFSLFALFFLLVALTVISLPRWTGRIRVYFDKIPPWSIYRLVSGSGWLLSLAALVDAGVGVLQANEQINETVKKKNPWLSERLRPCISAIKKGVSLGDALALAGHGFPDQDIIDDLSIYEPLPDFQSILVKMGIKEIDSSIARVSVQASILKWSLIFGFLFMVITIIVGVIGIMGQISGISVF